MPEDINKKLIDKIKESEFDNAVKDFLRKILIIELQNFEEGRPRYAKEYDRYIVKYAYKYGEGK